MITGPNLITDRDLMSLKAEGFTQPIAEGKLSSGQNYEIKFSAKSAVPAGLHLIITFPDRTELSLDERVDAYRAINGFASEIPLAQDFGYRFAENFGGMLTRPQPHAHVMVPGSAEERTRAPRIIDPWNEDA